MKVGTKERLLALQQIFHSKTDSDTHLSIKELEEELQKKLGEENSITQKALTDDITTLRLSDETIEYSTDKFGKKFYYKHPTFNIYELRLMMDALCSARFVSEKETEIMIQKLRNLTSENLADRLQNQIFMYDRVKTDNEHVKFNIDMLHTAIEESKEISFYYGRYNLKKEFEYSNKGQSYEVRPLALVWNRDYYYLIAEYVKGEIRHYRVDRMKSISLKKPFVKPDFDVADYLKKTFNMYAGKENVVEMLFAPSLLNVIYDQFGTEITIEKVDRKWYKVTFPATDSDGLMHWILNWGKEVKVLKPKSLVNKIHKEIQNMAALYQ